MHDNIEIATYTRVKLQYLVMPSVLVLSIINHTLPSAVRVEISTLTCTCMSMASNSMSDSEYY